MDSQDIQLDDFPDEMDEVYEINAPITLRSQTSEYSEPPVLSYSYSGISNASSNPDFHLQSSRSSEENPDHLTFFLPEELFASIEKLVHEVQDSLMLETDIVLYILYAYKWSKDKLYESYYDESEKYQLINSKLKNHLQTLREQSEQMEESKQLYGECGVCCLETKLIKSCLCEHRYCWSCWDNYIQENMKMGQVFFGCLDGCRDTPVLPSSFIKRHFPKRMDKYKKKICISYAKFNKNISYCPCNCDYFCQVFDGFHVNTVECVCGNYYCFSCKNEAHFPASCQDVEKWEQLLNNEEGNIQWINQNTKKCPSCKALVFKYIGCSLIKCVCGSEFCYNCLSLWNEEHKRNQGECRLKMEKKTSLQDQTNSVSFLELQEKIMTINQTITRHSNIIATTLNLVQDEWIQAKFKGLRKQVVQAWNACKWGLIDQFLYRKPPVEQFIEQQFISSITNLVGALERAQSFGFILGMKQLIELGDEVIAGRESLQKNQTIWVDAWRSC